MAPAGAPAPPLWLLALAALLPAGVGGQCGTLPTLSGAAPPDTSPAQSFPVDTKITYRCLEGWVKIPGKSDTVVCLSTSQWSNIDVFCGRSCLAPPRLKSAVLTEKDMSKNYYPVGTNVSYVCRPAYERTELIPVITCLENLTWSEAPEFCVGKSCGVPKGPEHGRPDSTSNNRFGAKVYVLCDDGYRVNGRPFIQCVVIGDGVEWSKFPTCQLITCSRPPNITNGMHNGSHMESFVYNSSVTYRCNHNFSLIGEASIHCTTEDKTNGVWNGSVPECKGSARNTSGNSTEHPDKGSCLAPPKLKSAVLTEKDMSKNYYSVGTNVSYVCRPAYERTELIPVITCLENLTWSEAPEFCVGSARNTSGNSTEHPDKGLGIGTGIGIGIGTGVFLVLGLLLLAVLTKMNSAARSGKIIPQNTLQKQRCETCTTPSPSATPYPSSASTPDKRFGWYQSFK